MDTESPRRGFRRQDNNDYPEDSEYRKSKGNYPWLQNRARKAESTMDRTRRQERSQSRFSWPLRPSSGRDVWSISAETIVSRTCPTILHRSLTSGHTKSSGIIATMMNARGTRRGDNSEGLVSSSRPIELKTGLEKSDTDQPSQSKT